MRIPKTYEEFRKLDEETVLELFEEVVANRFPSKITKKENDIGLTFAYPSFPKRKKIKHDFPLFLLAQYPISTYYLKPYSKPVPGDIPRPHHGGIHAVCMAFFVDVVMDLIKKNYPETWQTILCDPDTKIPFTDEDIKLIKLAAVYHDCANPSEETFHDEEKHAEIFRKDALALGFPKEKVEKLAYAIKFKDSKSDKDRANIYKILIHDPDCFEIIRTFNQHYEEKMNLKDILNSKPSVSELTKIIVKHFPDIAKFRYVELDVLQLFKNTLPKAKYEEAIVDVLKILLAHRKIIEFFYQPDVHRQLEFDPQSFIKIEMMIKAVLLHSFLDTIDIRSIMEMISTCSHAVEYEKDNGEITMHQNGETLIFDKISALDWLIAPDLIQQILNLKSTKPEEENLDDDEIISKYSDHLVYIRRIEREKDKENCTIAAEFFQLCQNQIAQHEATMQEIDERRAQRGATNGVTKPGAKAIVEPESKDVSKPESKTPKPVVEYKRLDGFKHRPCTGIMRDIPIDDYLSNVAGYIAIPKIVYGRFKINVYSNNIATDTFMGSDGRTLQGHAKDLKTEKKFQEKFIELESRRVGTSYDPFLKRRGLLSHPRNEHLAEIRTKSILAPLVGFTREAMQDAIYIAIYCKAYHGNGKTPRFYFYESQFGLKPLTTNQILTLINFSGQPDSVSNKLLFASARTNIITGIWNEFLVKNQLSAHTNEFELSTLQTKVPVFITSSLIKGAPSPSNPIAYDAWYFGDDKKPFHIRSYYQSGKPIYEVHRISGVSRYPDNMSLYSKIASYNEADNLAVINCILPMLKPVMIEKGAYVATSISLAKTTRDKPVLELTLATTITTHARKFGIYRMNLDMPTDLKSEQDHPYKLNEKLPLRFEQLSEFIGYDDIQTVKISRVEKKCYHLHLSLIQKIDSILNKLLFELENHAADTKKRADTTSKEPDKLIERHPKLLLQNEPNLNRNLFFALLKRNKLRLIRMLFPTLLNKEGSEKFYQILTEIDKFGYESVKLISNLFTENYVEACAKKTGEQLVILVELGFLQPSHRYLKLATVLQGADLLAKTLGAAKLTSLLSSLIDAASSQPDHPNFGEDMIALQKYRLEKSNGSQDLKSKPEEAKSLLTNKIEIGQKLRKAAAGKIVLSKQEFETAAKLAAELKIIDEKSESFPRTALHWAALAGDVEKVQILLKAGADPTIKGDKEQKTVLDFAKESKKKSGELIKVLEDALAPRVTLVR